MHPAQLCSGFRTIFLFCLVCGPPCYTLSRKKEKILIIGTLGSGWDHIWACRMVQITNFDVKTLIHALELKLWLFEVCIGSHLLAMFAHTKFYE